MEVVKTKRFPRLIRELSNGSAANRTAKVLHKSVDGQFARRSPRRRPMKPNLLNLISATSILLLVTVSQPGAQTPQRDNRPRTASFGGRVTVGGAPAANA